MNTKTILITAVGGNLGQAICSLVRKYYPDFIIIGCDSISPLQGYGMCNKLYRVPFATDTKYLTKIREIVQKDKVDLIIPCNDNEIFFLSDCHDLSIITLISPISTILKLSDKFNFYIFLKESGLPFCQSFLPSVYNGELKDIIVKPRNGAGSKNIFINPTIVSSFDDNYIIQELISGIELTISFYVDKRNQMIDFIPLQKTGMAPNNSYIINNSFNNEIDALLNKLITLITINGPCNLQCMANRSGLHPFEMNCRFSGSIDIQEMLGFKILQNSINEYLFKHPAKKSTIVEGFGIRQYRSTVFLGKTFNDIIHE